MIKNGTETSAERGWGGDEGLIKGEVAVGMEDQLFIGEIGRGGLKRGAARVKNRGVAAG
jgi:hypothetical protein